MQGDEPRCNKMIFIGKNLNRDELVCSQLICCFVVYLPKSTNDARG
eukprot:SAG31_NODE_4668_length_3047_cov_1.961330_1_plen_46_part_00